MSEIKIGLIGCGRIAQLVHLGILTRLPDVEFVAVAEPDPKQREEARRRAPKAAIYTGYRELLDSSQTDAVVIALPSGLHAETAIAALEKRKHVYLEKPLATNLADGRRVLEAWKRAGVVGMIGFNYRFNRLYQTARRHIESGRIGDIIAIRSVFSTAHRELPAWKLARQNGGGVLLDLGSHHMDLIHYLSGQEVREVFSRIESKRSEADSATVHLRLADGALAQSFFSMNSVEDDRFEIHGDRGKLTIERYLSFDVEITEPSADYIRLKRLWRRMRSLARAPQWLARIRAPGYEPSYQAALADFVQAVRLKRPATPDFLDGYRSLAILEAAEESAKSGAAELPPALGGNPSGHALNNSPFQVETQTPSNRQ